MIIAWLRGVGDWSAQDEQRATAYAVRVANRWYRDLAAIIRGAV